MSGNLRVRVIVDGNHYFLIDRLQMIGSVTHKGYMIIVTKTVLALPLVGHWN